jgi:hypothetical protein
MTEIQAITARIEKRWYEWMRKEAFARRISMTSIINEALANRYAEEGENNNEEVGASRDPEQSP